ncbi:unnamed protein product [Amoebophrya sp. A25]|nr:unnamed protein product [Amoebophrya sp. A25]|eukprot:GSA25T00017143001.1
MFVASRDHNLCGVYCINDTNVESFVKNEGRQFSLFKFGDPATISRYADKVADLITERFGARIEEIQRRSGSEAKWAATHREVAKSKKEDAGRSVTGTSASSIPILGASDPSSAGDHKHKFEHNDRNSSYSWTAASTWPAAASGHQQSRVLGTPVTASKRSTTFLSEDAESCKFSVNSSMSPRGLVRSRSTDTHDLEVEQNKSFNSSCTRNAHDLEVEQNKCSSFNSCTTNQHQHAGGASAATTIVTSLISSGTTTSSSSTCVATGRSCSAAADGRSCSAAADTASSSTCFWPTTGGGCSASSPQADATDFSDRSEKDDKLRSENYKHLQALHAVRAELENARRLSEEEGEGEEHEVQPQMNNSSSRCSPPPVPIALRTDSRATSSSSSPGGVSSSFQNLTLLSCATSNASPVEGAAGIMREESAEAVADALIEHMATPKTVVPERNMFVNQELQLLPVGQPKVTATGATTSSSASSFPTAVASPLSVGLSAPSAMITKSIGKSEHPSRSNCATPEPRWRNPPAVSSGKKFASLLFEQFERAEMDDATPKLSERSILLACASPDLSQSPCIFDHDVHAEKSNAVEPAGVLNQENKSLIYTSRLKKARKFSLQVDVDMVEQECEDAIETPDEEQEEPVGEIMRSVSSSLKRKTPSRTSYSASTGIIIFKADEIDEGGIDTHDDDDHLHDTEAEEEDEEARHLQRQRPLKSAVQPSSSSLFQRDTSSTCEAGDEKSSQTDAHDAVEQESSAWTESLLAVVPRYGSSEKTIVRPTITTASTPASSSSSEPPLKKKARTLRRASSDFLVSDVTFGGSHHIVGPDCGGTRTRECPLETISEECGAASLEQGETDQGDIVISADLRDVVQRHRKDFQNIGTSDETNTSDIEMLASSDEPHAVMPEGKERASTTHFKPPRTSAKWIAPEQELHDQKCEHPTSSTSHQANKRNCIFPEPPNPNSNYSSPARENAKIVIVAVSSATSIPKASQLLLEQVCARLQLPLGNMRTFAENFNSGYAYSNSLQERLTLIEQMRLEYDDRGPSIGPNTELVIFIDDVLASGATYMRTQDALAQRGLNPENLHAAVIVNLVSETVSLEGSFNNVSLSVESPTHILVEVLKRQTEGKPVWKMLTFLLNSLPDSGYERLCAYLNVSSNASVKEWLVDATLESGLQKVYESRFQLLAGTNDQQSKTLKRVCTVG